MLLASPVSAYEIDTSTASPLTGLWWNPSESGWGATLTQQSNRLFVTWFVYDGAGNPVWYTVSCAISSNGCIGEIIKVGGGPMPTQPWQSPNLATRGVGTMTLTFTDDDHGTMTYTLDGASGTKAITRQIFGPVAPRPLLGGYWDGANIEARSNCRNAANNRTVVTYGQYEIGMSDLETGALLISQTGVTGLQCTYSGNFTRDGARIRASGNYSCNDGKRGTWQTVKVLVTETEMSIKLSTKLDTTETCDVVAILGGSRLGTN